MPLTGKGFMIWKIAACEGGCPDAIAAAAAAAGLTHVLIKIADGSSRVNIDESTKTDLLPPVVAALHSAGIEAWGWHYVYGADPAREAAMAAIRVNELNLDGYVVDAESEWKHPGKAPAARSFMQAVRRDLPGIPVALSSFRFPTLHPEFPWREFLANCDYNMPQVYFINSSSPGKDLQRCIKEFQAIENCPPLIPTGPGFAEGSWKPEANSIIEFLETSRSLGCKAVNFYSWDYARRRLPEIWDVVAAFDWNPAPRPKDIVTRYLDALNNRSPDPLLDLYCKDAAHLTPARMVQGHTAIRDWYSTFLTRILPEAQFTLSESNSNGSTRQFSWSAYSPQASVQNGQDTLGLRDGRIAYHYSFYSVNRSSSRFSPP